MSDERKKPGVAFWATVVAVVVLVVYPLSFAPAVWLVAHAAVPLEPTVTIYRPIRGWILRPILRRRSRFLTLGNEQTEVTMQVMLSGP